jgi:hypothetical protein
MHASAHEAGVSVLRTCVRWLAQDESQRPQIRVATVRTDIAEAQTTRVPRRLRQYNLCGIELQPLPFTNAQRDTNFAIGFG